MLYIYLASIADDGSQGSSLEVFPLSQRGDRGNFPDLCVGVGVLSWTMVGIVYRVWRVPRSMHDTDLLYVS